MIFLNKNKITPTMFPDKTSQVWKTGLLEKYHGDTNEVDIEWKFESEDEIIHLAQLKALVNAYGYEANLYLPYLPYARQDKSVSNDTTFALTVFAHIINGMKFKEIKILDPHSHIATTIINNCKAIYPIDEIKKVIEVCNIDCICYPDSGASLKYTMIYKDVSSIFEHPIICSKVRDQKTGWITDFNIIGEYKDKNVLIIDDICDGGSTFNILSKAMNETNDKPKSINLFVTHGIFSNGLNELKKNIDRIFIPMYEVFTYGDRFVQKSY